MKVFTTFIVALTCAPTVHAGCPPYVEEGRTLTCTCTKGDCTSSDVTLSWPDYDPASPTLVQTDVQRQDNGSRFTCQMVCGSETSTVIYSMRVAYGPSADKITILGNTTLIADGTNVLNLTCLATGVYPKPRYTWLDSLCRDNYRGSTCSFRPQSHNDRDTVRCRASDTFRDFPVSVTKEVTLDLQYPPPKAPQIQQYTPGLIVQNGDILTCTVTGGKPRVANVIFHCESPVHQGGKDTTRNESVSSFIVVDTTNSTGEDIVCNCTAVWAPQVDSYTLRADAVFHTTIYRAKVTKFTINGTSGSLTVNEQDNVTVIFTCNARGRPAPSVTLRKYNGELLNKDGNAPSDEHDKAVSSTLVGVTSEDMGTYTCTADNNFTSPEQDKVQLNVKTAPKGNETTTKDKPRELTETGLTFTVLAYPKPDTFVFTFYGNKLNPTLSSVQSGTFNVTRIVEDPSLPVVICSIKPLDVPHDRLGVYRVEVSNGLEGTYKYFFQVKHATLLSEGGDPFPYWAIIVICSILSLAAVGVAVARRVLKGKHTEKAKRMETPPKGKESKTPGNTNANSRQQTVSTSVCNETEIFLTLPAKLPPLEPVPKSPEEPARPHENRQ